MSPESNDYAKAERALMLALARETIARRLKREKEQDVSNLPSCLLEERSCFVTLHTKDGQLRGCIGNLGSFEPLGDNIVHNAFNAAFRDPRFNPVSSLQELEGLEIEISVLTPPEDIPSIEGFKVGEHGIIMKKGGRSAVFLPQVAPEQGWDRDTTMLHLSMKAGLNPDAWKEPGCKFSIFRAIVFNESGEAEAK